MTRARDDEVALLDEKERLLRLLAGQTASPIRSLHLDEEPVVLTSRDGEHEVGSPGDDALGLEPRGLPRGAATPVRDREEQARHRRVGEAEPSNEEHLLPVLVIPPRLP